MILTIQAIQDEHTTHSLYLILMHILMEIGGKFDNIMFKRKIDKKYKKER